MATGSISLGLAVAHSPRIAFEDKAGPVWDDLIAGMHRAADALGEGAPDAVVLISAHWVTSFNIYADAAPRHVGKLTAMECPDLLRAIPYDFPGDPALAHGIVQEAKGLGLPAIAFHEPTHMLDYGTVIAMQYLRPEADLPTVPIPVCLMSSIEECYELGSAIREAIERSAKRVCVVSSSAFAHNLVRGPETFPTEEEQKIDRHLLALMSDARTMKTARDILPSFAARAKYEMGGRAIATLMGALGDDFAGTQVGYGPSSGSSNPVVIFRRVNTRVAA